MRYLGIDAGEKNIGVSFCDENTSIAFPLCVIPNNSDLAQELVLIANKKDVDEVVIGYSVDLSGKENEKVVKVGKEIENIFLKEGYKVHYEPEWFTTKEAKRIDDDKNKIDARSAAIILQSFLDRKNKPKQK